MSKPSNPDRVLTEVSNLYKNQIQHTETLLQYATRQKEALEKSDIKALNKLLKEQEEVESAFIATKKRLDATKKRFGKILDLKEEEIDEVLMEKPLLKTQIEKMNLLVQRWTSLNLEMQKDLKKKMDAIGTQLRKISQIKKIAGVEHLKNLPRESQFINKKK
jgi:hypothetical protein